MVLCVERSKIVVFRTAEKNGILVLDLKNQIIYHIHTVCLSNFMSVEAEEGRGVGVVVVGGGAGVEKKHELNCRSEEQLSSC